MRKRILALLLAFVMAVGLLPAAALALEDEPTRDDGTAVTMDETDTPEDNMDEMDTSEVNADETDTPEINADETDTSEVNADGAAAEINTPPAADDGIAVIMEETNTSEINLGGTAADSAHGDAGWTAVTMGTNYIKLGEEEQTSNTLSAGSYCLDGNLTVSLTVTGEVSLCLNGYSITVDSSHAVTVGSGASLTLCDAPGSAGKLAYTGTSSSYYGIYNNGTLTLNSGAVEGAYWGVCNAPNSTFTMTGGSVTGTNASSGYGVYNYSSSSVFRLSGGSVSGGQYGIYNKSSDSKVYLSGSPSITGTTADIYTNSYSSKIYADDGADTPTPYSGNAISLRYSSCSNGETAVYHVTEDTKDKFTLVGSISDNYELKFSEEDSALQFQGKPQTLTWYDINDGQLTGDGYPASHPYGAYFDSSELPDPPAVEGKLFLGWLYKRGDDSEWNSKYWSDNSIYNATAFKADYIDGFAGGSGTESDPYRIADAADLQKLATLVSKGVAAYNNSAVWYKLTENIDLSGVCGEGLGSWPRIGGNYNFRANFDGNGMTISNLYINTSGSYQGLFYRLDGATVKNLTITGSVTAGSDYGALAGKIDDSTVENVDVTGVILTPYGYTPDENRIMAYKIDGTGNTTIHIQGNYKNNWIQTTYARAGYSVEKANLDGGAVTASAEFVNGGRYVQLSYTVTAGETAITDGKLAVHADVQIGDNDNAAVEVIQDAAGEVIGLKMVDTHTNCLSRDAQFNLYFDGTGGVTPVDTYWFGEYSERDDRNSTYGYIYFAPLNDDTKSTSYGLYEKDASGVYTKLTGTDSGFAVSWQNINLDAGESKTYSFILGVGEKADPPRWGDGNAVSLTLAADVEQNNRLVNVSARVRDAAGLTDTLYYSVDGGEGEVLGEVAADGSMKSITGRLDLSDYAEGAYLFSFWVVNSKGAASASVEREITITADGIRGLDGDSEAGYGISGTVEKQGSPVAGAAVTLMRGNTQVAGPVTTDSDGKYTFTGVAPGSYNVVAAKDGKTMTILVKVVNKSLKEQDLSMPGENVNSVLDVKDTAVSGAAADVTKVVVGGLNKVADAVKTANSTASSVTVTMTVEAREENDAANADAIQAAAPGKTLEYLDIKVEKMVDGTLEAVTNTGDTVIEIVVPYDFSGKTDVTVYRYHGTEAKSLKREATKARGTFRLDEAGGLIHIYATKFSTYAIGYTPEGGGDTPVIPPEPTTPSTPPVYTGGGGSGPAAYPVETPPADGGKVTASPKSAAGGTTVTLTLTPDQGYEIGGVTVTGRDGKQIAVTDRGDGKYTFTMPSGKVTAAGVFLKIADGDCPRDSTCPLWPYTDINLAEWYHDGIHYCVENGLMDGYGNSLFRPNDNLSRAQFAQILFNKEGRPAVDYLMQFEDVPDGAWYAEAVRWAAAQGVVSGYGNGKFGPNDSITREQLAVMLWRYAGSPAAANGELHFNDAGEISGFALEAMRWAVENGIINGKSGGILDPQGLAARAETAQMLMNFFNQ